MAYLRKSRDSGSTDPRGWRRWLPGVCSLCRQSAQAWGLCRYCHERILACRVLQGHRCIRCDVTLVSCSGKLPVTECETCVEQDSMLAQVVTVFDYIAPADLLVHQFKSRRQFFLAPVLAVMLWEAWQQRGTALQSAPLLTAVPASLAGLRRRGFNPAGELARYVARRSGWAYRPGLVARTRDGPRQASLGRAARQAATLGLYQAVSDVSGRDIVIVDDVVTTGSTLNSMARSLHQRGAKSIYGLALARTPGRPDDVQ